MRIQPFIFFLLITLVSCQNQSKKYVRDNKVTDIYLYVSLDNEKKIAIYKIDTLTGKLDFIDRITANGSPGSLTHSKNRKYLYAALRSSHQVATFRINPENGTLRFIENTSVADNPVYIIPDKTNKYLLTAYWYGNKVAIYPIIGDSLIDSNAIQEFNPGINPHCILNDEANLHTYVAVMTTGTVNQYSFDTINGKLTPLEPGKIVLGDNIGPRHIDIHPNGRWVYIVNEINNTVYAYTQNEGRLKYFDEINTFPPSFTKFSKCSDIHITPDGKYVYAANRGHNSIASFAIDQDNGTLSNIGQYDTEPYPREFEIDPKGKFLYAGGEHSGKIAAYKINDDGSLTRFATYDAGKNVTWLMALEL